MLELGDDLDGQALAFENPGDRVLARGAAANVDRVGLEADEAGNRQPGRPLGAGGALSTFASEPVTAAGEVLTSLDACWPNRE